jgi:hypothetical protein
MGIKQKKIQQKEISLPKPPQQRYYSFEVIIYVDNVSCCSSDFNSFDSLVYLLKSTLTINHYLISPLHNHDYDDNGNLKKPHFHVYLTFSGNRSFDSVSKLFELFKVIPNNIAPIKGERWDCFKYSCHLNQPNKWLYDINDIVCDNIDFWQPKRKNDKVDVTMCIIDDLLSGRNLYDMAKSYGRDFVLHFKNYRDFVSELKFREQLKKENLD